MKKPMQEKDETPGMEAAAHSPEFLEKAASKAKRKKGGKRHVSAHREEHKKTVKRRERKRTYSKR